MRCAWRIAMALVLLSVGLSPGAGESAARRGKVEIADVPHLHQSAAFSGETCAAMFLSRGPGRVRPSDVFNRAGIDAEQGRGCGPRELRDALRKLGVETGEGCHLLPVRRDQGLQRQFDALRRDLDRGIASILTLPGNHAGDAQGTGFILALGFDPQTDQLIYHDPARADGAGLRIPRAELLRFWPRPVENSRLEIVRIPLATRRPVILPQSTERTPADFAGHVHRLRADLPSDAFHVVVQPPFVVVGDLPESTLRRHATRTVQWSVDRLKADYFPKDPDRILNIWLFRDRESYERYTQEIFGDRPSTPYGYYSRRHGALIMNIATGGGTLVHEIVHPFMAANFPRCPAWFNEGLASLYEQSSEREGRIWGLTNWRLRGLQGSIRDGRVPSFEALCGTSDRDFYHEDPGTNYAQARYLCYYLQEKGLLRDYYHAFRRSAVQDSSGYETLRRVLGDPDMRQFQREWQEFVLKLRF